MAELCPKEGCDTTCKSHRGVAVHWGHSHNETPPWREFICESCGETFERSESHLTDGNEFCSPDCYGEYRSENYNGEKNPYFTERSEFVCDNCDTVFDALDHSRQEENTFCDQECYGEWRTVEGKDPDYNRDWVKFREEAREKLPNICCYGGCERSECQSGDALHIHHITPMRKFDSVEDANEIDNLVPVCAAHHPVIENDEDFAANFQHD